MRTPTTPLEETDNGEDFVPKDIIDRKIQDICAKVAVYYQEIKRELNRRLVSECRCDERLKAKTERSTRLAHTLQKGPKGSKKRKRLFAAGVKKGENRGHKMSR